MNSILHPFGTEDIAHTVYTFVPPSDRGIVRHLNKHSSSSMWVDVTISVDRVVVTCPLLKWARSQGCPWDDQTCANAAGGGHLQVLQWARSQGCPWDDDTCAHAAWGGHLEVLQWAHAHGCPWDEWTCAYAASGGHLEVLKWARANGCPWDEKTCTNAVRHPEVLQWARMNGCPENMSSYDIFFRWAAITEETPNELTPMGHLNVTTWRTIKQDNDRAVREYAMR